MTYKSTSKSKGRVIIQGMRYFFESGTSIVSQAVIGERYFNPDTGKFATHSGQQEYEPITLTALLSPEQFIELNDIYESDRRSSGELSAVHQLGEIKTTFTGVILERLEYGDYDVASNDAAKITLRFSYSNKDVTRDRTNA